MYRVAIRKDIKIRILETVVVAVQCLNSTNWLTLNQYFEVLSILSMLQSDEAYVLVRFHGSTGNRLPKAASTLDSEGGASATPCRITIMITHFCVRDAFQPHESWSIAQQAPPVGVWLNEHTQYPGGASVRASHEQKCVLLWSAFWNPFKTVNELWSYNLKTPSWILYTPHYGG